LHYKMVVKSVVSDTMCVPTEIYPYIYQFLVENDLSKTAKKFKKETKINPAKPAGSLVEIFAKHAAVESKKLEEKLVVEIVPEEVENENQQPKEDKKCKKKRKLVESQNESDETETKKKKENGDAPETKVEDPPAENAEPKKKKKKKKNKDISLNDTVEEETPTETNGDAKEETMEVSQENVETEKKIKKKKKKQKVDASPEMEDEKSENNNYSRLNETVEDDSNGTKDSEKDIDEREKKEESTPKVTSKLKRNESFRRVVAESVYVPQVLADNSFDAKIGSRGDWGEKANEDLRCTKGKSFRHEKTKKKRGSYRGGNINTSVNSIKFDNSDED